MHEKNKTATYCCFILYFLLQMLFISVSNLFTCLFVYLFILNLFLFKYMFFCWPNSLYKFK